MRGVYDLGARDASSDATVGIVKVLSQKRHSVTDVDPFGRLPCKHRTVIVHITDGESMGDDLVECDRCGYVIRLADLYKGLFPGGMPPVPGA